MSDQVTENPAQKAFETFAAEYDHESNEWLDMDPSQFFEAGYAAALIAAERALMAMKLKSEGLRYRTLGNAIGTVRALKQPA